MKTLLQCKACGFIIVASKLKQICPACGLPKTVFEDYDEKISYKRRIILELDLHPLSVHFTQALGIGLMLIIVLSLIFTKWVETELLVVSKYFCYFLPLSVFLTIILGIFDGVVRFKKIKSPLLNLKIILGIILLIVSCLNAALVYYLGMRMSAYYVLGLSIIIVGLEAVMGRVGSKLIHAVLKD